MSTSEIKIVERTVRYFISDCRIFRKAQTRINTLVNFVMDMLQHEAIYVYLQRSRLLTLRPSGMHFYIHYTLYDVRRSMSSSYELIKVICAVILVILFLPLVCLLDIIDTDGDSVRVVRLVDGN